VTSAAKTTNQERTNKMTKYQSFARKNYTPLGERDEFWHPEIIAECDVMDAEHKAKIEADKAKIKKIVGETADISAALTGNIIVKVTFRGSHAKKKALTPAERKIVMTNPPEVKAKCKGDKPLFECKKYDNLIGFIADRRNEFARFGIPHVAFDGACVTSVHNIPAIEDLTVKTEKELKEHVDAFIKEWPDAIEAAKEELGPLFNPADYKKPEELRSLFTFGHTWLAFGVPDELKQFDAAIYAKAQAKAKEVWDEIQANGVVLLRQTIADLVGGLADSLTPHGDGKKKKFHPSSVEKIHEFIETFSNRNICKDAALEGKIKELKNLVDGIDPEKLSASAKGDELLREKVRAQMEAAKKGFDALLVDAGARVINLE
jgi:hypothetical protein